MTIKKFAVLAPDTDLPLARFIDLPTALAWGYQQFKSRPFVVRVHDAGQTADMGNKAASAKVLSSMETTPEALTTKRRATRWM